MASAHILELLLRIEGLHSPEFCISISIILNVLIVFKLWGYFVK